MLGDVSTQFDEISPLTQRDLEKAQENRLSGKNKENATPTRAQHKATKLGKRKLSELNGEGQRTKPALVQQNGECPSKREKRESEGGADTSKVGEAPLVNPRQAIFLCLFQISLSKWTNLVKLCGHIAQHASVRALELPPWQPSSPRDS